MNSPSIQEATREAAQEAVQSATPAEHSPEAHYKKRNAQLRIDSTLLEQSSRVIAALRVLFFLIVLGGLAAGPFVHWPAWGSWAIATSAFVFLALVILHANIERRADLVRARNDYVERAIIRVVDGAPSRPEGIVDTVAPTHPYAHDLDLFGSRSFSSWLDGVHTRDGQASLARTLLEPCTIDESRARQQFVKELADRHDFRESLSANAVLLSERQPDEAALAKLLAWSGGDAELVNPLSLWVTCIFGCVTFSITMAAFSGVALLKLPAVALVSLGLLVRAATQSRSRVILETATPLVGTPERYAAIFGLTTGLALESDRGRELQAILTKGTGAEAAARGLGTIGTLLDARENGLFRMLIGPLLQWDLLCSLLLERWRAQYGKLLSDWISTAATFEAAAALATRAFEETEAVWPEFVSGASFVAADLGHPLIARALRVSNNVTLSGPGEAWVITGSNMAGKSTLLRAIGLNGVLAYAGGKVCASKLQMGHVAIVTSVKVADALADGVSFFYAEVQRLKVVLNIAEKQPTLFLLDEILRGTNSRERIIGAKAVIEKLLALGAVGAVSTHDLAISQLAENASLKVTNVHFEEQVEGDVMRFDYVLRPGVVQTSNALRLMKEVGLPVPDGEL